MMIVTFLSRLKLCMCWVLCLTFVSCASLWDVDESRGPASSDGNGRLVIYDESTGMAIDPVTQAPIGPDLARSEFNRQSAHFDQRARQGFRRQQSPWDGTGPVNEGSLWNPESQDGFFFTRNLMHKIGDVLIVKVEEDINTALNRRIEGLLGRARLQDVIADESGRLVEQEVKGRVKTAVGNEKVGDAVGKAAGDRTVAALESKQSYARVDEVPVRITEILPRNTYRIEGVRQITVMGAPYNFSLSGLVRDEDIGSVAMVSSSKIVESRMELSK